MTNTFNLEIKMKEFILALDEVLINYPKKEYNLKDKIQLTSYEILELICDILPHLKRWGLPFVQKRTVGSRSIIPMY